MYIKKKILYKATWGIPQEKINKMFAGSWQTKSRKRKDKKKRIHAWPLHEQWPC